MHAVSAITRRVREARPADAGRGIARLDPADFALIGVAVGDIVEIHGDRATFARVLPTHADQRGLGIVLIDGATRANAGRGVADDVVIKAALIVPAKRIILAFDNPPASNAALKLRIAQALDGIPLVGGDQVRLRLMGGRELVGLVSSAAPAGPVLVTETTDIDLIDTAGSKVTPGISYEDLGGLGQELARIREMIELPIRRPEIFAHLGIEAPKGVLLSGPPGTGKTLLARAVAEECNATFFQISGPEIVGKHYGESEAQLRDIFKQATAKAPSIVFIDEIDAIAPKRDSLAGDRQVERRIVAQLLTLLDGLKGRGQVIIMAATNLPDSLDPALRRPGRFDREINIGVPDRRGRREILDVHTRGMPLAADVDLDQLASVTHGFVGADLAALSREAGMAALRKTVLRASSLNTADLAALEVTEGDFTSALAEVQPSALREVYTDVPEVSWSDVGGAEAIKQTLIEAVIWPLRHKATFKALALQPTKGVLLAGSPGTGKTLIAKALANEAGVNFISVRGPQLLNQYLGESERAVRSIFAKARSAAPCIIFFDEIDALAPVRGQGEGATIERVVAQLLTEIDGIDELKGVFLLAATNRVDRVDPALLRPGRFDLVIEVPLPDAATRARILEIHTQDTPLSDDVLLGALAAATGGFAGADLKALAQGAALVSARRLINAGTHGLANEVAVTFADFESSLAVLTASRMVRFSTPNET